MLAMAVVNHQGINFGEGGSGKMEEEDDILARLRYLRQTLQECHRRVGLVDQRVEALKPSGTTCTNTPAQGIGYETSLITNTDRMSYECTNGHHFGDISVKDQDTGVWSLHNGTIVNGQSHIESHSAWDDTHKSFANNDKHNIQDKDYIMHLAQKHASELYDMYWSKSSVNTDIDSDGNCSKEISPVKKRVTWKDEEIETFSYIGENKNQNYFDHYENGGTIYISDDYLDDSDTSELQNHSSSMYLDGMEDGEYHDRHEDKLSDSEAVRTDQTKWKTVEELYEQVDRAQTNEKIAMKQCIEEELDNGNEQTGGSEGLESLKKDIMFQSLFSDIKEPWFKRTQDIELTHENSSQPKRRKHALIRTRKIDLDDDREINVTDTDKPAPQNVQSFGVLKMLNFVEETEKFDSVRLGDSDDIIIEDVSSLEIIPEESECENPELCFEEAGSSYREILSDSQNETNYVVMDDIASSKPVPDNGDTVNKSENALLNMIKYCIILGMIGDKYDHSITSQDVPSMIENLVSRLAHRKKGKMDLESTHNQKNTKSQQNKCESNNDSANSDHHTIVGSNGTKGDNDEISKNVQKEEVVLSDNGIILHSDKSKDLSFWVLSLMLFLLLVIALFIVYLIITVPVLVVSHRHNRGTMTF